MIKALYKKLCSDKLLIFLLIFSCIYIAGNIGTGSLTNWDEAVYANVSREMVRTGDWIKLQSKGSPWVDKPPLYFWMTSVFYRIFGVNEFSTRVTSSLFGVLNVALVYLFLKPIVCRYAALAASLTLLGLPHYLHFAKMGMLDVTLTFFLGSMVFLFWKGEHNNRYLFLSGLALAGAYLAKGSAAFLGIGIIVLYCTFTAQFKLLLNKRFLAGLVISIVIILSWHLLQYMILGPDAVRRYFSYHVFSRATEAIEGHSGGPNFYQKAIFNKNMPWSIFLFISFTYVFIRFFRKHDKFCALIVCWVVGTYLAFSLIQTKLHWYIIPIYPALAMSCGVFADRFLRGGLSRVLILTILLGLLLQIPSSWAFKLDFSPDLRNIRNFSLQMQQSDRRVYVYKLDDDKDFFYLDSFSSIGARLQDKKSQFYCIVRKKDLGEFDAQFAGDSHIIKSFDDFCFLEIN